jgi:hypothetical protein
MELRDFFWENSGRIGFKAVSPEYKANFTHCSRVSFE